MENESRNKMQEADVLVTKVVNLSNPSRTPVINHTKSLQTPRSC